MQPAADPEAVGVVKRLNFETVRQMDKKRQRR
jgi:hypothetical protein